MVLVCCVRRLLTLPVYVFGRAYLLLLLLDFTTPYIVYCFHIHLVLHPLHTCTPTVTDVRIARVHAGAV